MKKAFMKKVLFTVTLLLVFLIMGEACNTERHLAKPVIGSPDSISVCILLPEGLFKDNLKTWEVENYDSLPEPIRDSLLYFNSKFLQHLKDEEYLRLYTQNLYSALGRFGVRVYPQDSLDAFLAAGGKAYLFSLAQVIMEEYMEPFIKTLSFGEEEYQWEIWQNAVAMNVWYEARVLNRHDQKVEVLYDNMYVRDKVRGRFEGNPMLGDLDYIYRVDTVSMSSVYTLAERAGTLHANFIFDYIINDQIASRSRPGYQPVYMHFDAQRKKLLKAGSNRFTLMKTPE